MKKNKKIVLKAVSGLVLAGLLVAAGAGLSCKKSKIVVLNVEQVRMESVLFRQIIQEQQKFETILKTQIMVMQDILQEDAKNLSEKEKKLSASEARKAHEELDQKATVLQNRYQAEAAKIAAVSKQVIGQMNRILADAISDFAEENAYDLILPQSSVIFTRDKRDVTKDFVALLDKKTQNMTYADLLKTPAQATDNATQSVSQENKENQKGVAENINPTEEKKAADETPKKASQSQPKESKGK